MKKFIAVFLLLTSICVATFAADEKKEEKWRKPYNNQICFVVKVSLSNNINKDFYAIGLNVVDKKDQPSDFGFFTYDVQNTNMEPIYGTFGEFVQANIAKKDLRDAENGFYLPAFRVRLFGLDIGSFHLPVGVDVTYPADAKYVYLGTFVYTINESDLTVKNVRRVDEYEAAKKALTQKLGQEVTLVRAELAEHKKVEKKK